MAHMMMTPQNGQSRPTSALTPSTTGKEKITRTQKLAGTIGRFEPSNAFKSKNGGRHKRNGGTDDEGRYDARFKVVMLGESGVGKTSLIRATVGEPFNPTMISTIGIDFVVQTYNVENYRIQLQIWDTAGQERYRSLATSTFRDAKAFIIVYDITSRMSFDKIREEWLKMTDLPGGEPIPVFFVGNKADLLRLKEVPTPDAQNLSQQQYAHGFFETSALTGVNVNNLFQSVATAMVSTWSIPQLYYPSTPSAYNSGVPFQLSSGQEFTNSPNKSKKTKKSTVFQCCSI